ncbi:MAG: hypothetical protein KDK70_09355 [Myxococcales bacterium]|nr:hypothetical protein [Myxococcales bacterium]
MSSKIDPDEGQALRLAFAQDPPRFAEDPVDAEALWEAVRGEAEPAQVAALVDRMADDRALAEDWRMARAFAAAADEDAAADEGAGEGKGEPASLPTEVAADEPASRGDYLRWGALVALVAAAVLLVLAWPRGGASPYEPDDGRMRGASGGIEALRGEGPVSAGDAVLQWSEVPGAVRYELHVSTGDLRPRLHERDVRGTSWTLPAEVLREAAKGETLLWRVEAVTADGTRVTSETFALTVQ